MLGHHLSRRCELRSAGETVHHLGGQVGSTHGHTGRPVRTTPPEGIPAAGVSHRVGLEPGQSRLAYRILGPRSAGDMSPRAEQSRTVQNNDTNASRI
jgi:hypothetical protein